MNDNSTKPNWQPGWILQPGQLLVGNYRVTRMVGSPGGMGQVFAAEDILLRLKVAIKVPILNIIMAPNGPQNFLKEARIAAHLGSHQHIVQIRACLTDPELKIPTDDARGSASIPFIVMEFLGGGNLAQRLKSGVMPFDMVSSLFGNICSAVQFAHSSEYEVSGRKMRGVVHRDLKPENICFDEKGRLVVVDFGLARLLEDPSSSGGIIGTPSYMAPEQWSPDRGIDHRTDVYALGVILYQMVTGRLPFVGSIDQVMKAHLYEVPPDARSFRQGVPTQIAEVIRKALQKEKSARFETVEALSAAALEGFKQREDPDVIPATMPMDAAIHRERGDDLARKGDYDSAISEYNRALLANPNEVLAIINRGFCWYRKQSFDQALADYTRALQIDPTQPEAYNNRGMVWKDIGEYEKAIDDFRKALRFDPDHPLAPNNLTDALRFVGT